MYSLNFEPLFREVFNSIREYYLNVEENKENTRNDYVLKKLWENYGIQRKVVGNDLYLLNYSKTHNNYDRTNQVTKLCRHLVLDMNSMRIVSLGVEKSVSFDREGLDISNLEVTELLPGTMIIYNPSLKEEPRFYTNSDDNVENTSENTSTSENTTLDDNESRTSDPTISTRKKIGTSHYNSTLSFESYFKFNNSTTLTNVEKLNNPEFKNYCFVFNCEHTEEHITNYCRNTLVRCYEMKPQDSVLKTFTEYIKLFNTDKNTIITDDIFELHLSNHIVDIVKIVDLNKLKIKANKCNVGNLITPKVHKFDSYDSLDEYISHIPNTVTGLSILDTSTGIRYKYTNNGYEELRELRGDLPLHVSPVNQENLFKIYYRIIKSNNLHKFLSLFDKSYNLMNIFAHFQKQIQIFSNKLFKFYIGCNVEKKMKKEDIPKMFGVLCYELHGIYLKSNVPTTPETVYKFIFDQDPQRIYWRIFEPSRYVN